MTHWQPSLEYILVLFKNQIGNPVLINEGGLVATLDKVRWGIPFGEPPSLWDQVTILYQDIIQYHFFHDGNKRIGSLLAYIFLHKNGYSFEPPVGEIFEVTMEVAQGVRSYNEIKAWFERNSKPLALER
ncbi:MAG: type II toxin-antitoxin system death-on-curing family toxin [Promethearchaeota archaeon]